MTSPAQLSSASDNWPTPVGFYDRLDAEFGFVLDVCSSVANHKAPTFYALDHPDADRRDGLAADWAADAKAAHAQLSAQADGEKYGNLPRVWMNPPYGKTIAAWMEKAVATAEAGCVVVCLVPVRAGSRWFHDFVFAAGAETRYVRGRLTFGEAKNAAPFDSVVVVLRPSDVRGTPGPVTTMPARVQPPVVANDGPSTEVAACIEKYTPRQLDERAWSLAAEPVRAAVRSIGPRNRAMANTFLSAAAVFLVDAVEQGTWSGEEAPDLGALLSTPAIEAHIRRSTLTEKSASARRSNLRRLSRSIGGAAIPKAVKYSRRVHALEPLLNVAATMPFSVADVMAAWLQVGPQTSENDPLGDVIRDHHRLARLAHTGHTAALPSNPGAVAHSDDLSAAAGDVANGVDISVDTVWSSALVRALTEAPNRQVTVSSNNQVPPSEAPDTTPAAQAAAPAAAPAGRPSAPAGPTKPGKPGKPTPGKPLSRRAQLAAAKLAVAERAAAAAAEEALTARRSAAADAAAAAGTARPAGQLLPAEDEFEVSAECRAAIDAFRAKMERRHAWDFNLALGRVLVLAYQPPSPRNTQEMCSQVAALLTWLDLEVNGPLPTPGAADAAGVVAAAAERRQLTMDDVTAPGMVEAFLAASPWADASKASTRSYYRRILARLDPATHRPAKLSYTPVLAPYTPEEVLRYVRIASHQPTKTKTLNLGFVVGLGLGAGLDSRDTRRLTRASFTDIYLPTASTDGTTTDAAPTQVLMVTVPGTGVRARTVPVRAAYAPLVRRSLALHQELGRNEDDLIFGTVKDRNNLVNSFVAEARTAVEAERVELRMSRLRATWLVAVMTAPVSVLDALAAAGLSSSRTLLDLLPYCPAPEPGHLNDVVSVLAQAANLPVPARTTLATDAPSDAGVVS